MVLTCDGKSGVGPDGRVPSARPNLTLILRLVSSTRIYNLCKIGVHLLLLLFSLLLLCPLLFTHLQVVDPLVIIAQDKKPVKAGQVAVIAEGQPVLGPLHLADLLPHLDRGVTSHRLLNGSTCVKQ